MRYTPTSETVPCVPLYGVTDPPKGIVEFLGTGTCLHYRGRYIVATAAHVIQRNQKFILLVAGAQTPLALNGAAQVTPIRRGRTRNTDPLDFCAIDLSAEHVAALSVRCHFIDLEADGVWDVPCTPYPHRIMGYPEDGNRPSLDKALPANGLRIDCMEDREIVQHCADDDYREHPTWYIGLRYDPRRIEPKERQPKVTTLHGFSGGAIWRTTGAQVVGFAGIVTESAEPRRTGERLVYGIRSIALRDLLTTWSRSTG